MEKIKSMVSLSAVENGLKNDRPLDCARGDMQDANDAF